MPEHEVETINYIYSHLLTQVKASQDSLHENLRETKADVKDIVTRVSRIEAALGLKKAENVHSSSFRSLFQKTNFSQKT